MKVDTWWDSQNRWLILEDLIKSGKGIPSGKLT